MFTGVILDNQQQTILEDSDIQELILQCSQGSRKAYHTLYNRYRRSMYNTGWRIVRDPDDAEDVLQDAFISAFRNLNDYRFESTFGAWLKRIVVNKAINHVKKKRMERIPDDDRWDITDQQEPDVLEGFPFTVESVKKAIALLPEGYRLVLTLYLMEGYDHAEIGEILVITESTSKSQFNRAKKKLKELLEGGNV